MFYIIRSIRLFEIKIWGLATIWEPVPPGPNVEPPLPEGVCDTRSHTVIDIEWKKSYATEPICDVKRPYF